MADLGFLTARAWLDEDGKRMFAVPVRVGSGAPVSQPDLFGTAETSSRAFRVTGAQRRQVYEYLVSSGGATDEEIGSELGMAGNTVRPRRGELVEQGLVKASSQRRETAAGNDAIVWVVVERVPGSGCVRHDLVDCERCLRRWRLHQSVTRAIRRPLEHDSGLPEQSDTTTALSEG